MDGRSPIWLFLTTRYRLKKAQFLANFIRFQRLARMGVLAYNTASVRSLQAPTPVGPLAQLVERVTLNH